MIHRITYIGPGLRGRGTIGDTKNNIHLVGVKDEGYFFRSIE